MIVDEFLPVFDVSDEIAVVVDADVDSTWRALLEADLGSGPRRAPPVGANVLRWLPKRSPATSSRRAPGRAPSAARRSSTPPPYPRQTAAGSCSASGETDEIALGMIGKFWRGW